MSELLPNRFIHKDVAVENQPGKYDHIKFSMDPDVEKKIHKFINVFSEVGCLEYLAQKRCKISNHTVLRWKEAYPDFGPHLDQKRALLADTRMQKADTVIDNTMDSEDEGQAFKAAAFTVRRYEPETKKIISKNLHVHTHIDAEKTQKLKEYLEKES